VVDNEATIFFTIFMALWATFFIEFWKRQQARIQYDWDVADYEETEVSIVLVPASNGRFYEQIGVSSSVSRKLMTVGRTKLFL